MHGKRLIPLLLSATLIACSDGGSEADVFEAQKQAIDKASEVEHLLQEQAEATHEQADKY